jgi:hypothetical protein
VNAAERAADNRAKNAEWVERSLAADCPPLTNEQRTKLWELLRPIRDRRTAELRAKVTAARR